MAEVTLEMVLALVQRSLDEQAVSRRENRDVRSLLLALTEQGRRTERRIGEMERRLAEVVDDVEVMLKAELMGRLGHFETQIDVRLSAIEERLRG